VFLSVNAVARADATQDAHAALRAGDRLRDAGDLRGALERYSAAYTMLHEPPSGLSLARTQTALGLLVEARQTAADTSALPARAGEPADFAEARDAAAQLASEIEPRLPVFGVVVTPDTPYTLRIDGTAVTENAQKLRFRTNPGEHELEIEASGYERATQVFTLGEGVHQLIQVSLYPVARAPAPAPGVAVSPPPLAAAPDPASQAQRTRGYIAVAAGAAVATAGAIAGVLSFTETSNAKRDCPNDACPDRLRGPLETADTLANIANVALPIGLLGLAYGMIELLTLPAEPEASRAPSGLSLQIDGRGAYAALRGTL
jgi:hypothetical protein